STGSVVLTLKADQSGQANVIVTVTYGGLDGNLSTTNDNGSVTQTFSLTVNPLNDPPTFDSLPAFLAIDHSLTTQTITVTGITAGGGETQALRVTATAAVTNPQWVKNVQVAYPGTGSSATVTYQTNGLAGTGQITITVT